MLAERYPDAVRVRLALDNLNTHGIETFEPQEARNYKCYRVLAPAEVVFSQGK